MQELTGAAELAERSVGVIARRLRANLRPPLAAELRETRTFDWRADLAAGATVALLTVPQCIGFALIVGLPLDVVLGAAVIGAVVCTVFSSSRHLVFGPTNTISILLAGAIFSLGDVPLTPLEKVLLIGMLVGAFQLAAGLSGTGRLARFVSRPVVVAYTTGVALLIAAGQLSHLLGIGRSPDVTLPGTIRHLVVSLLTWDLHWVTLLVGLGSLALLLVLRRWRPAWPEGLIVMLLAAAVFRFAQERLPGVLLVGGMGELQFLPHWVGLPLNLEGLALVPRIVATALAIALLGMLEAVSIAKSLAARSGQRIDPDQELIGMGAANILCSAFGAMPGSASFLRSAANLQSGARSRLATVLSCVLIPLLVFALSPLLASIPVATLAAYLVLIAFRLLNPRQVTVVRRSTRSDAAVFWVTLGSTLFLPPDTAIYVGVGLSVGLFLQKASEPSLVEYAVDDAGALRAAPARADVPPQISIVHVEGDLFFGAADPFHDQVRQLAAEERIRVVILRLKNARLIDASTVLSLLQLREFLHGGGRHLLLSGVMPPAMRVLRESGALAELGEENVFVAEENPTVSTKRALQRAQALLGAAQSEVRLFYDTPPAPAGAH